MKRLRLLAGAFSAFIILSSCGNGKSSEVPAGQVSSKIIHNPRTANGVSSEAAKGLPKMVFTDTTFNFGTMNEGERVEHEFTFKNAGGSPLIIAGAETSCGCTTPSFTHDPIPPGGNGMMKVAFASAGKHGHILKSIVVTSNAFPSTQILTITADIKGEEQ